jgi:hypothetical protein
VQPGEPGRSALSLVGDEYPDIPVGRYIPQPVDGEGYGAGQLGARPAVQQRGQRSLPEGQRSGHRGEDARQHLLPSAPLEAPPQRRTGHPGLRELSSGGELILYCQ